jgi:hypothetical protein
MKSLAILLQLGGLLSISLSEAAQAAGRRSRLDGQVEEIYIGRNS